MNEYRRWYDSDEKIGAKGPVFVVCAEGLQDLYRTLQIEDERIVIHTFRDAQEQFPAAAPDLVIVDCTHFEAASPALISGMKSIAANVPVIALSTLNETVADTLLAGARIALRKPLDVLELQTLAERLLQIKRHSRGQRKSLSLPSRNAEASATSDQPVPILRVMQYIEKNYADKISLDALAREANLSKYHFCRYFTRHTGISPMKFVTQKRIERAKEFLKRKDQTVSIVSFLAGFNDLGTFIRQFKTATGLTPSVYQHSLSAGAERPASS